MKNVFVLTMCFILPIMANPLLNTHPYEPYVRSGWSFRAFEGESVDHIFLFAYDSQIGEFKMMPFQIDERIYALDDLKEGSTYRRTYFKPDDGLMDNDDEVVWMVRDMGDKAPEAAWIDNAESRHYQRVELKLYEKDREDQAAYAYAFCSSTIPDTVPRPYDLSYDQDVDAVSSHIYKVGFNESSGILDDIMIKAPYGNGIDVLDTQKIRVAGALLLGPNLQFQPGRGGQPDLNERDFLYIYPFDGENAYLKITEQPVVRLIREVRLTIILGGFLTLDDLATPITTKFYPYSGQLEGGLVLNQEVLDNAFPTSGGVTMEFDQVRHSFDFNENAIGMKFMNSRNSGVLIDGNPDDVDHTITNEDTIRVWTLSSGDQGTVFTYLSLNDTSSLKESYLYYYDDKSGGNDDNSTVTGGDTGDGKSYGDHGFKVVNGQSFELNFNAYFLPSNQDQSLGEQLAKNLKQSLEFSNKRSDFTAAVEQAEEQRPESWRLLPVYPNPFNRSAVIRYELNRRKTIRVDIIDIQGRLVTRLVNREQSAGHYRVMWSGRDAAGNTVGSGIYWVVLKAGDDILQQKLTLIK
ncbi:MAG: FlgD immunoglobulin-like domain containing protein [candidate division KSB1 bacterium]|nr:FlgD immunoglobulin-like domain containing protein [candidate division KSB1 bacterium]